MELSEFVTKELFGGISLWSTNSILMVITSSQFAGMKFHPVQQGQISRYDCVWKLNIVPIRRHNFPDGILWIFLCNYVSLWDWKPMDFHWFYFFFFAWVVSILVHKIRSSRSQMFFKIVFSKVLQNSQENISVGVSY